MKIIIYATITVSAQKRQGLLDLIQIFIPRVLKQEGCLNYDWAADGLNATQINVYEEWENQAALKAHFEGENFTDIGHAMREYGILGASATKFRVDKEAPVFNASGTASAEF